jgi:hydroxysqualene dehydroxylase
LDRLEDMVSLCLAARVCMQVDIIGGGYAGCAAALSLLKSGHTIRLWESRPELGGRARRIPVESSKKVDASFLDNGQHLIAGAYHHLIDMLERLYAPGQIPWRRLPLALYEGKQLEPWFKPVGCWAPFNMALGLIFAKLSWKDRFRFWEVLKSLQRKDFFTDYPTVHCLEALHASFYRRMIEPLCLSIFNTPADKVCTERFFCILQRLLAHPKDSDALFAEVDLTTLFPDKVADQLSSDGHQVNRASRVRHLIGGAQQRWVIETSTGTFESDAVILAVAPDQLNALLEMVPQTLECIAMRAWVNALHYAPITTIYFQCAQLPALPYPMVQLDGHPGQWLFDRTWGRQRASVNEKYYAVVISVAYTWLTLSLEERRLMVIKQIVRIFDIKPEDIRECFIVNEKRATYCVEAKKHPPSKIALGYRLYVAGDYIDPLLPATLEAAVKSGVLAAKAVLNS